MWVSNDEVVLSIWDNGVGAPVVHDGIGLKGMKERLEEQGGILVAGNVADGFELTVRLAWTRKERSERPTPEPSADAG
jgi:signal transduction histidine kinase